jgi:hypothetical protein
MDTEKLLWYGGLALLAYLLYQKFIANPLQQTGAAAGGALYNALHPNAAGASVTYRVVMPDGSIASVNNTQVAPDGSFNYQGTLYNLTTAAGGNAATLPVVDPTTGQPIPTQSDTYLQQMTDALASG